MGARCWDTSNESVDDTWQTKVMIIHVKSISWVVYIHLLSIRHIGGCLFSICSSHIPQTMQVLKLYQCVIKPAHSHCYDMRISTRVSTKMGDHSGAYHVGPGRPVQPSHFSVSRQVLQSGKAETDYCIIQGGPKNVTPYFCPYLRKLLIDF